MATVEYSLGDASRVDPLYPPVQYIKPDLNLRSPDEVIAHFTESSLRLDGIGFDSVNVSRSNGEYVVCIASSGPAAELEDFAACHRAMLTPETGGKAVLGEELCRRLGVWNPMEGYPVNSRKSDGKSKWNLFLPLGMGISQHRAVTLLHYPPWQALQEASYLNNMTLQRWERLLAAVSGSKTNPDRYKTILDVNPIAAPGSGESEYPNDYFPIMLSSACFDGPGGLDYIRSMLDVLLNPPHAADQQYTLPLLVCGSPLYDPQAPGWFRVAYKDHLEKDAHGIPQANVLQAGLIRIREDSPRPTPFMIANHMIAAGVTGQCTPDPTAIPDIRMYEAQDLVAAEFLTRYAEDPDLDPAQAKAQACQRWFGNDTGKGPPQPPEEEDQETICVLAQMDLFFDPGPPPKPLYSEEEARKRCRDHDNEPCCKGIAPPPPKTVGA